MLADIVTVAASLGETAKSGSQTMDGVNKRLNITLTHIAGQQPEGGTRSDDAAPSRQIVNNSSSATQAMKPTRREKYEGADFEVAGPRNNDDLIPLPNISREKLADMIRAGDHPFTYQVSGYPARVFKPSDVDKVLQAREAQIRYVAEDTNQVVFLEGDDRLMVFPDHTGNFVEMTVRQAEQYAKSLASTPHAALGDILLGSVEALRKENIEQPVNVAKQHIRGAYTQERFWKEAMPFLAGIDENGDAISAEEELSRSWALFENTRKAETPEGLHGVYIGRLEETDHTGAQKFGYTSEYKAGAVLQPENWTILEDFAWIAGLIKGEGAAIPGTLYKHAPSPGYSDLRSSDFDKDRTPLNHYIAVMSTVEIDALMRFGYVAIPHDTFGTLLVPSNAPEDRQKREDMTLADLYNTLGELNTGLAVEGVTHQDRIVPRVLAFIHQDSSRPESKKSLQTLGRFIDDWKSTGLARKDKDGNMSMEAWGERIEYKIDTALGDIQKLNTEHSDKTSALASAQNWREIRGCVLQLTKIEIEERNKVAGEQGKISSEQARALRFDLVRELDRDRVAIEKGEKKTLDLGSRGAVGRFIDKGPSEVALKIGRQLDSAKAGFLDLVEETGRGKQKEALWKNFELFIARKSAKSAEGDVGDMTANARLFLASFSYIPGVAVPKL